MTDRYKTTGNLLLTIETDCSSAPELEVGYHVPTKKEKKKKKKKKKNKEKKNDPVENPKSQKVKEIRFINNREPNDKSVLYFSHFIRNIKRLCPKNNNKETIIFSLLTCFVAKLRVDSGSKALLSTLLLLFLVSGPHLVIISHITIEVSAILRQVFTRFLFRAWSRRKCSRVRLLLLRHHLLLLLHHQHHHHHHHHHH